MSLLSLSPELILHISSFLHQVDLLNLSILCKRVQTVTEPELFREYTNTKIYGRSFIPFIRKIIQRPGLQKYVRKLELRIWETLDGWNPEYFASVNGPPSEAQKKAEFDKGCNEMSETEYIIFTEAAKANGCIVNIFPYERESFVVTTARNLIDWDIEDELWSDHVFDNDIRFSDLSYDRIFCQMLRAGLEEPLVALLVALLPNVKEILLYGVPGEPTALNWRANHGFKKLRAVIASGYDGETLFPIAFFNPIFAAGTLESFEALATSSWSVEPGTLAPESFELLPLSLQPSSLNLKVLELRWSILTPSELRVLLEACHELKVFRYTGITRHSDITSAAPAEMIGLLRPFQESLEELVLSFEDEDFENLDEDDLIHSVKHMTSLKRLSVPPECWWATVTYEYDEAGDEAPERLSERGLSCRLPPSLETLSLPISNIQEHTAVEQIQDIILNHAKALPHLSVLYIGAHDDDEEYLNEVDRAIKGGESFLNDCSQQLTVSVGREQWHSVFDTLVPSREQPVMRWFGNKYAYRQKKPNRLEKAMQAVTDKYRNQDLGDEEWVEKYRNDPDFKAICADTFGTGKDKEEEEVECYDQDQEDWKNYSH